MPATNPMEAMLILFGFSVVMFCGGAALTLGIGCDDDDPDQGGCAVDRGMDYHQELGKLNPKYVALCKWKEDAEQLQQHRRKMRAACVN